MVKKKNPKKAIKKEIEQPKEEIAAETSYIDWKIPAAFVVGILVTVLFYNLPEISIGNTANNASSAAGLVQTIPTLYILNDEDCALCDYSWITASLSESFNYTLEVIDVASAQGQQMLSDMEVTSIPAVFLSSNFVNNSAYSGISNYLVKEGDYYVLRVQGIKDLTVEESSTPKVDVFVMSQCPYGTPAQTNVINLMNTVSGFDLNMHYIVDIQTKAEMDLSIAQYKAQYDAICEDSALATQYELACTETEWQTYNASFTESCELKSNNKYYCSLHGPTELNLDIIQVCAMNLSANWGEFILEHIESDFDTAQAANASGIDYNALMSCANSSLGLELLDANVAVTDALGIGASPTYIFDNVYKNPGQDASVVLCSLHPALAGCENIDTLELATSTGSC